jgi:putative ABC transport system permease protein
VDIVRAATSSTRFVATLLLGFATSAVLLAGLGIYGVVAYIVSQRSREFGLRLALGAQAGELVLATVRRSVWLVGGGVAAGLFAAIVGARLLGAFLYGSARSTSRPTSESSAWSRRSAFSPRSSLHAASRRSTPRRS